MRKTVGLALVHFLGRPDQVFPSVLATTRAGHDVVQAALVRLQEPASVLAAVSIALTDGLGAQLRALLRHLGIVHRHDDGRHANLAANGMHCLVLLADRQCDPLLPAYWTDVVPGLDLQARSEEHT